MNVPNQKADFYLPFFFYFILFFWGDFRHDFVKQ